MGRHFNRQDKYIYVDVIRTAVMVILTAILLIFKGETVLAYDDIVVVIDPGHGGVVTDTNNNGGCIYNGVQEKDVNLITAQALYDELSQYKNVTTYMTRTTDVEMSLEERIAFAKSVDANVVVSVHYNASANHNYYGSEIFTSMYGQPYATGTGLGRCIMEGWNDFGSPSKGIKTRKGDHGDYYGLIRNGCEIGMPVIILEHGYLDNDHDFSRMGDVQTWQELGRIDAEGIVKYYGFKKDTVQETITPTVKIGAPTKEISPDDTPPENVKLTVEEYNPESGEVKYKLSAAENQSILMYYGFRTGKVTEDTVFDDLFLWDNSKGVQEGVFEAPKGYDGTLTVRVYNSYELFSDGEPVTLSAKEEENNEEQGETADGGEPELDSVPNDFGNGETKIIDEIILGNQAEYVEISPDAVNNAENAKSQKSKALLGIAIAGSIVALAVLIGVTVAVYSVTNRMKKGRGKNKKKHAWEDDGFDY